MTDTATGHRIARVATGIPTLDAILRGGLPQGSVTVFAGPPGSGKTVLAQQICFHNATASSRALYFNTLSEPTAKTLLYLRQFEFFDPAKFDTAVRFVDLGVLLREQGLGPAIALMMDEVRRTRPALVVVDSFKAFDDLARSPEELRKFGYEVAINLMAWEATALLLGEYAPSDLERSPIFSVVDGLCTLTRRDAWGESQRVLQVVKMRGTDHGSDEQVFAITSRGLEVYAPRLTLRRDAVGEASRGEAPQRLATGIANLDVLLGDGIPLGSSVLVAGAPGTGKTVLLLEFLYRGALAGERGVFFSFEETEERLRAAARGLGWDLDREIARGAIEIVFIPQPDILVERHLQLIHERVAAGPVRRVAIDSVSVFLHKIRDPQVDREKIFQLATVVHNAGAVGLFATDVPFGSSQISRFGVEETVVDGVILLTASEEGLRRQRYLEVYKLRNTAHLKGRHAMQLGAGGITVFPRYDAQHAAEAPPAVDATKRMPTGVPGLDALLGGGLLPRSVTLVSGSTGAGKSTLAMQFLVAGAACNEAGVYLTLEEGPEQLLASADALGIPLRAAVESGLVEIRYVSQDRARAAQFPSVVTSAIVARGARRLVLDSASQLLGDRTDPGDLPQLLHALVVQSRRLGATCVLTVESRSLYDADVVTDRGLSPIADNLLMLRYAPARPGEIRPTVLAIKTRGSAHDWGTYALEIGPGGMRVGPRLDQATGDPRSESTP